MKKMTFWAIIIAITFLLVELFPGNAEAIPAFAKKYRTACMTCHATFPRQTALGEAFRLNGYKMPEGDELYIKDTPVSMGAEAYKRVFPKAVWPSDIPGLAPFGIRIIGDAEWDTGQEADQRDNEWKIEFPHELEILFGGAFGDNMSFFGEIELEHPGEEVEGVPGSGEYEGPSEIGFEAWLMWEDILGKDFLNIKAGNIGMNEIDPPNARDHARITKSHYLVHEEVTKGLGGPGLEANGFGKHWRYAAGYVKPQDDFLDGSYYVQGALKFRGLGFDGTGGTTEEGGALKATPSGYWRDDAILLGGFYFKGDDNIDRYGVDARVNYIDLSVATGYVVEDVDAAALDQNVWFAEVEYFFFPWMQGYFRFESLSDDIPNEDKTRYLIGTALLARANVKVNVEGLFHTENEERVAAGRNKDVDNRLFIRLDYAF